jgi:bifunctional non-homologous end joining protein LigD
VVRGGTLGQGLTAEKMKECVWVKPELVAEVESLEWTDTDHLPHTSFVGLKGKHET